MISSPYVSNEILIRTSVSC